MEPRYAEVIANDEAEVRNPVRRLIVDAKLAWYALSRPFWSARLKRALLRASPALADDPVFRRIDVFLRGEGGMFKKYAYAKCDRLRPLRNARVLVPGIGYAKNLLQLAEWKPARVFAFDLYEYAHVWPEVQEKVRNMFGVPVIFAKGEFDAVPAAEAGAYDLVVSDAVLEHVPDMGAFAAGAAKFLKKGGVFYASFGPLWYGPSGDHVTWGADRLFDHLLLPSEAYAAQVRSEGPAVAHGDSCDSGFMLETGLFSYLRAQEYIEQLEVHGFEIVEIWGKVSLGALRLLVGRPDLVQSLDAKGVPAFDRFSGGLYIWARKRK